MAGKAEVRPLAVSRKDAATALGLSTVTIDRLIKTGALKAKWLGGRVLVPMVEIERYLEQLPDDPPPEGGRGVRRKLKPPAAAEPAPAGRKSWPSPA